MSDRLSLLLSVVLLLLAAVLRFQDLTSLPAGLNAQEITNIRIIETARNGNIEVFYDLGDEGREGFYQILVMFVTSVTGNGTLGYRVFSVWFGMLTVAVTYAAGRRLFSRLGGLVAAGLMAVSFWPLLLSRLILPQTLLPFLVGMAILLLSMVLPIYKRRRKRGDYTSASAVLGFSLGVGIYIHPAGLLIVIFSLAFIGYMLRIRKQMSRRRVTYIGFTLLVFIIMSVPYLVSTVRNPDLGGIDRLTNDDASISMDAVVNGLSGVIFSGDENPTYNIVGRPLFDPFSALMILVGLVTIIIFWREPRHTLLLIALVVISPVFLLSGNAPNFVNYAAALPLFALVFAAGVTILHENLPIPFKRVAEFGLIGLLAFNIISTEGDLLDNWSNNPEVQTAYNTRLGQLANYIDYNSDDIPIVICGWDANQTASAPTLNDAQLISLMLNRRQGANIRYADCYQALVLADAGAEQQIIITDPNVMTNAQNAIRRWLREGTFINGDNIPEDAILRLDVEEALAAHIGRTVANTDAYYPPEADMPENTLIPLPVSFGGNLTLLGHIIEPRRAYRPGDSLVAISYWRTQGTVPNDLTLFTHVLADPAARPPANTDITHVNPRYLRDRDVFIQVTDIPLPDTLPAGIYQISIGGYQNLSGERLNVLIDEQPRATRLFLNTINIES